MTEATAPATETLADEATMQELVKLNEQRAATYGLLSRLYRVEVDQPLPLSILACSSGVIIKSSRPTFTKA